LQLYTYIKNTVNDIQSLTWESLQRWPGVFSFRKTLRLQCDASPPQFSPTGGITRSTREYYSVDFRVGWHQFSAVTRGADLAATVGRYADVTGRSYYYCARCISAETPGYPFISGRCENRYCVTKSICRA